MTPALSTADRADAHLLDALLSASVRVTGAWALLLSAAVAAAWLLLPLMSPLLVALGTAALCLGSFERIVAFRLALDQHLFKQLALGQWPELSALDAALTRLGLIMASPQASPRPWVDRVNGTRQLFLWHVTLVLLQTAATIAFLFTTRFLP